MPAISDNIRIILSGLRLNFILTFILTGLRTLGSHVFGNHIAAHKHANAMIVPSLAVANGSGSSSNGCLTFVFFIGPVWSVDEIDT